jgi:hypothetical protein
LHDGHLDIPFGGFVCILGAAIATLLIALLVAIPAIGFALKKRRVKGGPMV